MAAPLEGVLVLEHTQGEAGAIAARALADLGAEVIKVESLTGSGRACFPGGDAGKRGVAVNLEQPQGMELYKRLAALADVVVEDGTQTGLNAWRLEFETLHRERLDLIYVRLSTDDERCSQNRVLVGAQVPFADVLVGLTAAGAILTALHYRRRTGKGQCVEVSPSRAALPIAAYALMEAQMAGRPWGPKENRSLWAVPQGCYPCRSEGGRLAISVQDDGQWQALCQASGHPEWENDERFIDVVARSRNHDALDEVLTRWTRTQDPYQAFHTLQRRGVPAAPVLTPAEACIDPHLDARRLYDRFQGSEGHTVPRVLTAKSRRFEARPSRSAPEPGEHTRELLRELLGLPEGELQRLEAEGVIGVRSGSAFP